MRYWLPVACFIVLLLLALVLAYNQVRAGLIIVVWAVVAVTVLGAMGITAFFGLVAFEKYLLLRANRRKAELESSFVESAGEKWYREVFKDGHVELARLGGLRLRINSHDHSPTPSEILYAQTRISTGQSKMLAAGELPVELPREPVDLLGLLDNAERVLVKGASDAGKTTLLQHVAARSTGVVVIDPHNKPGQWPSGVRLIGNGYNFTEVTQFFDWFVAEIEDRYVRRSEGDEEYPAYTIIIDEFITAKEECRNAGKTLVKAIRECRKIKMRLFIGSHSELVKPLGLDGASDVRDGLLIVRLDFDQITKQRLTMVDYGRGERACQFPPYYQQGEAIVPDLVIEPMKPSASVIETQVLKLYEQDYTISSIAEEVFGGKGGPQNSEVRKILEKFGQV